MILKTAFTNHTELLDGLTSPIYVKDENHRWVYVNQAFCKFFDHTPDYLIGKTDYDVTPKEQSDVFWEKDNEVFKTQQTNTNIEITTNGRGETVWVESKKSYFENSEGEAFIFGVLTDVTLLKDRELELEDAWNSAKSAEIAKSQFLANMSHEVRTPMNGIIGMTELLEQCDLTPHQKDFVDIIQRSGDALLTIINDILDFSKIEAGQLIIDPAPFEIKNCIEDVMALLAPKVSESGIDLLLRIQPNLPTTYVGDAGRIRQILTNLVGNAVKFTTHGHVYIDVSGTVQDTNASLTISVSDTGIGIAAEKLETIFDKFNQADISTTRIYGGTGLGLNIARDLVGLMGGELKVKSEESRGSCFHFTIDLPWLESLTEPEDMSIDISGMNVLVVDDNAINRMILTEQLKHWNCKSVAVESAKLGVAFLKKAIEKNVKIDLIIADYQMPEFNGEDFIRIVKADQRLKTIPSIMLSSVNRSELKMTMEGLGIDAFLTKPTRSSTLVQAIVATQDTAATNTAQRAVIAQKTSQPHLMHKTSTSDVTEETPVFDLIGHKLDSLNLEPLDQAS